MPKGKANPACCCSYKKKTMQMTQGHRTLHNVIAKVDGWFYHIEISRRFWWKWMFQRCIMYSMKLAGKQISCQIGKLKFKQSFLSSDIKGSEKTPRRSAASCAWEKNPVLLKRLKNCSSKGGDVNLLLSNESQIQLSDKILCEHCSSLLNDLSFFMKCCKKPQSSQ